MGLFSSKTKIYVSSVVYNMADPDDKSKFLPVTLVNGALENTSDIGVYMMNRLLSDAGIRLRRFYTWSINHGYADYVGLGSTAYYPGMIINYTDFYNTLRANTSLAENQTIELDFVNIGWYDDSYVVDYWVYINRPDMINDPYTYEDTSLLLNQNKIKIIFSTGETVEFTHTYPQDKRYIYGGYRIVTTDSKGNVTNTTQHYIIYPEQTGKPYFDKYFKAYSVVNRSYFPYIPLREDKTFYSSTFQPTTYDWVKKAFKKLTGSKNKQFTQLIANLEDNDSVDDIFYAYIILGSAINTKYPENKKYIFEYFYNLYLNESITTNSSGLGSKSIVIKSDFGIAAYNTRIEYNISNYNIKSGKIYSGAKEGDYDIVRAYEEFKEQVWVDGYEEGGDSGGYVEGHYETVRKKYYCVYMRRQISNNRYDELRFTDLKYYNTIYKGKSVTYNAYDELAEEDESGFIIPLEYNSFKEIGLIDSTDFGNHCMYIVFNTYVKKKVKWYKRGIFKYALQIAIIAIVIYTGQAELLSISSTLGLTGTAGLVTDVAVTALVTVITNMAVNKFILPILISTFTAIFGEVVGNIVATIVAGLITGSLMGGKFSLTGIWGELCNVSNIFMLTVSGLNGYSSYLSASAQKWYGKTNDYLSSITSQIEDIQQRSDDLLSSNSLIGMSYVNTLYQNSMNYSVETPASFLERTKSIITTNLSFDLIHNYPKYTLALPLAGIN